MLPGDAAPLLLSENYFDRLLPFGNPAWCCTRLGESPRDHRATLASSRVISFLRSPPIPTDLAGPVSLANDTIRQTIAAYPGRTTLSCSFGGPSGMVLLDLALRIEPHLNVFVIDTELLFPETYALIDRAQERYGITVERVRPVQSVAAQNAAHGDALWLRDPDACCSLRKVEPLREYLHGFDAWLTAVRRDQGMTRAEIPLRAWDESAQVVKVAPLADWTDEQVWDYVQSHELPVNTLHFDGYPSIGCVHCTRRIAPGEHARAGRWPGFDKTECGIHVA